MGPIAFGFNTFVTIQEGIDAVDASGTVNVLPGTYIENVLVNKSLHLIGLDPNAAGNGSSDVIVYRRPTYRMSSKSR